MESGANVAYASHISAVQVPAKQVVVQPAVSQQVPSIQKTEPIQQVSVPATVESEEFTPPPISKKPDGNDINSLWQALLINIKSPSTTALLKLATPLQISPEGVLLTFKNERLVAQINDSNKKQLIVDAAKVMFNQENTSVIIRLAQAGDKPMSMPTQKTSMVEVKTEPVKQVVEEKAVPQKDADVLPKTVSDEKVARLESDQEKMVLELFDGKYVE